MATEHPICRRAFLKGAGAGLLSLLTPRAAEALLSTDAVFISACRKKDGSHGIAILTEQGTIIREAALPDRGHGFAVSGKTGRMVAFARRPGSFALALDKHGAEPAALATPQGRHFFGHGIFNADGRLLYTTENDFENDRGVIGIWDAGANYSRIGEFQSFGLDPHDMVLMEDGHTLCIANGGILTHPESGRAKLNLDSMQPSIAFVDTRDGSLSARLEPPAGLSRLSLRHLAAGKGQRVWFGGQWEGSELESPPLIGHASLHDGLHFAPLPESQLAALNNYVGSVAASRDGSLIAFTSPDKGTALILDSANAEVVNEYRASRVYGVAGGSSGFVFSSENGSFGASHHDVAWDNHIAAIPAQ